MTPIGAHNADMLSFGVSNKNKFNTTEIRKIKVNFNQDMSV